MSPFKPGARVRCVKPDRDGARQVKIGDVLVVGQWSRGTTTFWDTLGSLWFIDRFELVEADALRGPYPSANPGHLHQSTDRYSPTWVSRP